MRSYLLALLLPIAFYSVAQDSTLLKQTEERTEYAYATFKTNRIVNGHSIELVRKNNFDLKISHRFGTATRGFYDLFGLDEATMRFGGDYGVTDNLNVGIGRSTVNKTYDGFVKYRLTHQSTGLKTMPVTIVLMNQMGINTLNDVVLNARFAHRLWYVNQLLIARKISNGLSVQLSPIHVHRNLVDVPQYSNDLFLIGGGLRQKLTSRVSLNLEYFYLLTEAWNPDQVNTLSIGFDIETGGHIFQLFFTNAIAPYEEGFLISGQKEWQEKEFRFGFNIARMFTF